MKKLMIVMALAMGLVTTASASIFDAKVYNTGKPVEKPMFLHELVELTGAHPVKDLEFTDLDGARHKISDYRKKLLFIDMWATWCEPCERELKPLAALQKRYNTPESRVRFIAVSVDKKKKNLKKYLKLKGVPDYDTWRDVEAEQLQHVMPPDVMPSMIILDGAGNLVAFIRGFVSWDDEALHGYIEKMVEKYADR